MDPLALGSLGLTATLIAGAWWLVKRTLDASDARRVAEVNSADLSARLAAATAAADTADRLRRQETARANTLEDELAHADQAHAAAPDAGARRRVLAHWGAANRDAVPSGATGAGGDAGGPVSTPEAADAER